MDEWSEREREALKTLPQETTPPAHLEARVIAELRRRGLLGGGRWWMRAVAAAILLAVGFAAGHLTDGKLGSDPDLSSATPRYLVLLRESSGPTTSSQVQEYSAWARRARAEGTLLSGEKLTGGGRLLHPGRTIDENFDRAGEIGGFFLITAPDLETATKIAASTPHLRYGGTVELRPIDNLTQSSK